MLALALALVVAVDEPSAPPLLPADAPPPADPMLEPALPRPPTETELVESDDPSRTGFYTPRVLVVGATSAGIGATLVGSALAFALACPRCGSETAILGVLSLPASLFLGTGVAAAVHRAMGGQGSYGAHLGGGAMGGAAGLLVAAFVFFADNGRATPAAVIGGMFALSGFFGAGTALMAELSNWRTLRENRVSYSLVPVRGGAVALAGFSF